MLCTYMSFSVVQFKLFHIYTNSYAPWRPLGALEGRGCKVSRPFKFYWDGEHTMPPKKLYTFHFPRPIRRFFINQKNIVIDIISYK